MNNIISFFRSWQKRLRWPALPFLLVLAFASSCTNQNPILHNESGKNLVGLASIINLTPNGKEVLIADYFIHPELIDSISLETGTVSISDDDLTISIKGDLEKPLDLLRIYSADTVFSIPVKKSTKIKSLFRLKDPEHIYKTVAVAGDVNQWNPQLGLMNYENGQWQTKFWLAPGPYQYQLVVDGKSILDPYNPDSVDNNIGGYNSSYIVQNPATETPHLQTIRYTDDAITVAIDHSTDLIVLWQNQQIKPDYINQDAHTATIYIPESAKNSHRSLIRIISGNKSSISNDLLIPLEYGQVVSKASELTPSDWHNSILYFMMVDRFYNGDSTNDSPLNIPEVNPKVDYFGGDIKGITQKIKAGYFNDLHVNSIWLSPIVQNPLGAYGAYPNPKTKFSAYHGYWPVSWNRVDFRLGSPADLKEMVAAAHEHGLNVLVDFVANHVHEEHPIYKQHPDWATNLYLPDGRLNIERWDEYRLTTWFDTFLPTLDLTNPELTNMLTDSAVFWINEYDLDGFRHDATKHVPEYFWRELTKKLKKEVMVPKNKSLYQIGETYGSRELIASYINSGEMDAQFAFGTYDNALACFARQDVSFNRLQSALNESFKYYGHHNLMGNITGNQDKPRFMAYAGGNLKFNEDSKLAGWTRDITVTNPIGYEKLKSFIAFNLTIPGIPVIYYGDEVGMTGANDPDNRRPMRFNLINQDEQDVKGTVAKLAALRTSNLELSFGDFIWLHVDNDVMAYARTYFRDISIIAFNKSNEVRKIQVKLPDIYKNTLLHDLTQTEVTNSNGYLTIEIQPNSFRIIQTK